jgi:(p)ppGpp synthase/HD superfamily hydrolase
MVRVSPAGIVMRGYSDPINHALAFAAKHHDQQVRRGARLPYLTRPANVALILTRYHCSDVTVIAGILHDVVEDGVKAGLTREMFDQRIGDKFGRQALDIALSVSERNTSETGVDLSPDERRRDYLARLSGASDEGRWVCAANAVHHAATLLADLQRTMDPGSVWSRYTAGRSGTIAWYRKVWQRLRALEFESPIVDELGDIVTALENSPT